MRRFAIVLGLLLFTLSPVVAAGANDTGAGTIVGTIRHAAGASFPAGVVDTGVAELIDRETLKVLRTTVASEGNYRFSSVPTGDYILRFSNDASGTHVGFFPEVYSDFAGLQLRFGGSVIVREGETVRADANLAPLFDDMFDSRFGDDIFFLRQTGTTRGCNPESGDTLYCPDAYVTRGQMAAFLQRFLALPPADPAIYFQDMPGTLYHDDALRLAGAGITRGCNPPRNDLYCPDQHVTRGQMAAFLVRAFGMSDVDAGTTFGDTGDSTFGGDIARLATAGVTRGCNPPGNTHFCPDRPVTRGEMAAFLHRAYRWDLSDGQASSWS